MIITRTPFRLSLLGGGSDYPGWFLENGGLVVGGTVNRYSYLSVRYLPPFHTHRFRLAYADNEQVGSIADIKHRAIRACLEAVSWPDEVGLDIAHQADLPGRSGTGSSSSFVVGLLNALASLQGGRLLPHELAQRAIDLEQNHLGETVGCQDQTFAAHGGLRIIRFLPGGGVAVRPLGLSPTAVRDLEEHLLLFFTGISRTSSEVAAKYVPTLSERQRELWAMMRLAEQGIEALQAGNHERLGRLIDQSWRLKSALPGVSSEALSGLYERARLEGAFGGKITGAGGGGCLVLVAPPEKHPAIIASLVEQGCLHIPFRFEHVGSQVLYADEENLNELRQRLRA